ncbi:HypC/HybG/HupF family hydrogenase formation chaperone [candidate division WOR-3 bacterium]|nr:HypC/HybG/HupF family hydrogenase formation chaperone [candidate division WOR-3 bacterium]MCK4526610.1 HypC/HybG/HupF family hydrogenase formation chaperone [candidate division WOR-3 bacterium]
MCLAIPMELIQIDGDNGIAELSGVKKEVCLRLLPEVKIGDYLIIHAGFAIQKMDEEEARKTLEIWEEIDNITKKGQNQ